MKIAVLLPLALAIAPLAHAGEMDSGRATPAAALARLEAENRSMRVELGRLRLQNVALAETNVRLHARYLARVELASRNVVEASFDRPAEPVRWREVARFSGVGLQNTAPFVIAGEQWRVRWTCRPPEGNATFFAIFAGGPQEILLANTFERSAATSYGRGRGKFSLDVVTAGMKWTIVVEEAVP